MAHVVKRIRFYTMSPGTFTAAAITFDNTDTGLLANNVQEAIEETLVQISDEVTRASTAEGTLDTKINEEIADRIDDVNAEEVRALAAESVLTSQISTEVIRATGAENTLTTNLAAEVTRATTKENQLTASLAQELLDRAAADSILQANITAEGVTRAGVDSNLQSQITAEVNARTSADTTLQTNITTVSSNLTIETAARIAADSNIQSQLGLKASQIDLTAEITRATTAEGVIQTSLNNHVSETTGAHTALAISYDNTNSGLTSTNTQSAIDEMKVVVDGFVPGSEGDIAETEFSFANAQTVPSNVTGFVFNPSIVRSFTALVSVSIDGTESTDDLSQAFTLTGVRLHDKYVLSSESVGDSTGVSFDITSLGQVTYTSENISSFETGRIKYRAITTTV